MECKNFLEHQTNLDISKFSSEIPRESYVPSIDNLIEDLDTSSAVVTVTPTEFCYTDPLLQGIFQNFLKMQAGK